MPRRRRLIDVQRASLPALPTREVVLIRHFTLAEDDQALVATRKHPETKLGLALQLCALRYPGRLLRPGELIPIEPLAFLAEQVGVGKGFSDGAGFALGDAAGLQPLHEVWGIKGYGHHMPAYLTSSHEQLLPKLGRKVEGFR